MRIAMFTNNYKPFIGGVPISIERLSNGLKALGHEVFIFAPTYEGQTYEDNVIRYRSFRNKKKRDKFVIPNIIDRNIERRFKELNIDIIHVHHPMLIGWSALSLGRKYNIPVTFTYHTRFEQYIHHLKPFNYLENICDNEDKLIQGELAEGVLELTKEFIIPSLLKNFANSCNKVFAPTKLMEDYLYELGVTTEIDRLPTGLEESSYIKNEKISSEIRDKYIEDKSYLFCTVSRLAKEKNIDFILLGLERLKQYVGSRFKMLIIGDGALKDEFMEKAKKLNLEENIVFVGAVPNEEIIHYYGACDLFLFASKSETQGIVLLEAMAAKNPVVAIEASGVCDIVKNDINGYMTDENLDNWVEKIIYLMSNKSEMERLRHGAYRSAKEYSNNNIAAMAEKSYKETIREFYAERREYILHESINIR